MKKCSKCGIDKDINSFSVDRSRRDGRVSSCKSCKRKYFKSYYAKNSDSICQRTSEYRKRNPSIQKNAKRKWEAKNRDKHLSYRRDWHAEKYSSNISYRLNFIVRGALKRTLDAAMRNKATLSSEQLGYSTEMLKKRIEMNFKPGMSWENYGKWHIDHRVPVARLIRRGVTSPSVINCLANLAPLWAEENMKKGKR